LPSWLHGAWFLSLSGGWSSPLKDRTGQTAVESESAHGKEA